MVITFRSPILPGVSADEFRAKPLLHSRYAIG
jgi:hypothetical protein